MRRIAGICVLGMMILFIHTFLFSSINGSLGAHLYAQPAVNENLIGPVYPPPMGVDWSGSGNSGQSGGATWNYLNITLANFDTVYWGSVNDAIRVSFNDSIYSTNEIMQYNASNSNPGGGVIVWDGTTFFPQQEETVFTRFTLRLFNYNTGGTVAALEAGSAGLPQNTGGVLWVISGLDFTANFIFEASYSYGSGYQPALEFFDQNKPGPSTPYLSFNAGFYYVNSAPSLTANNAMNVNEGQAGILTSELFSASDLESDKNEIYFNIAPNGLGDAPHFGILRKDDSRLNMGDSFTQEDLEAERITYEHSGGENTEDNFTFNISDGDGRSTPTGEHLTYTFNIQITPVNDPPVTASDSVTARVNCPLEWHFSASDVDIPSQELQFSIVTNGKKGVATVLDETEGRFRYTPTANELGNDTLLFQVYDGQMYSVQNGVMAIFIEDVPVLPQGHILIGRADPSQILMIDPADGQQSVYKNLFPLSTNPDLKVNDMVLDNLGNLFAVTNDTGLIRVDYLSGEVTILAPVDSFGGPISIDLSPAGDIFVCDMSRGVIRVDSESGEYTRLSNGGYIVFPVGVTVAGDGSLYITDAADLGVANGRVIRIDPANGAQTLISQDDQLSDPAHLMTGPDGKLYISDLDGFGGTGHILSVNPDDGSQAVIASGNLLIDPLGIDMYNGNLYVPNLNEGNIIEVGLSDGTQRLVFSDTSITEIFGLYIIQETISTIARPGMNPTPDEFELYQNYPNPFNPATCIRYRLSKKGWVNLEVYDITGRKVETLVNRSHESGTHSVMFTTTGLASGVYIYGIRIDGHLIAQRKMVLLR